MGRSLALGLYLLGAAGGDDGPLTDRPARPDGCLIWLHMPGGDGGAGALSQLARRLLRERPGLRFLVTAGGPGAPDLSDYPAGSLADKAPPERSRAVRAFLAHWRPDILILPGPDLPPALITETDARRIPMILVDVRLGAGAFGTGLSAALWRRGMDRSLLSRFRRVMTEDPDAAEHVTRLSGGSVTVDVAGPMEDTPDPPPCSEAERDALATLLRARPVWAAMSVPEVEEDAVIGAHTQAMRLAHRMLLILVPADAARVPVIADRLDRAGWVVALRAREQEPDPEVQVLIADDDSELGLWCRLAPVTFMGGTLAGGGDAGRSPLEPAALGSAILCGPHGGAHAAVYARLGAARALRLVRTPAALADAVADLIAPDRAAQLAHNAWTASSGGAEVADRIAEAVLEALDADPVSAVGA